MKTISESSRATNIEKNLNVFKQKLPELLKEYTGKFVLLSDEKIVGIYDTVRDAKITGEEFIGDGKYSIQQVLSAPINLGFFSYAGNLSAAQ